MLTDVHRKLKAFGKAVTWGGIALTVFYIINLVVDPISVKYLGLGDSLLMGLVALVMGVAGFWLIGLLIYGFGQLIENTEARRPAPGTPKQP